MSVRFYKKLAPTTHPKLPNGQEIKFTTLDHLTGYFGTDNQALQQQFEQWMGQNRYGITEISAEEFDRDYLQKKNSGISLPAPWREEIGGRSRHPTLIERLGSDKVAAAVAVNGCDNQKKTCAGMAMETTPPSAPGETTVIPVSTGPEQEFKPTVGKRKRTTTAT